MEFPSKLVERAVEEIAKLPGIGKKTALRLVLHILKEEETFAVELSDSIKTLRQNIQYCQDCFSISDNDLCSICANKLRESGTICVVEDTRDVLAIENTNQYRGLYHVLGGIISPLEGIGPGELNIEALIQRVIKNNVSEIILAINPTMEGDTTSFYITKKLKDHSVKVSTIARGIPVGGELEYADEITLGRSILTRTAYNF